MQNNTLARHADFDWFPRFWHEQYNGVVYKERAWGWSGKVGIPLYELGAQNSAYLKEGDTAIVYWDGQEYKRTVQYYETDHPDSRSGFVRRIRVLRMGGSCMRDLMEREQRAREYSLRVRERRKIRATWIITAIEVCLAVYSILLAVAIHAGGGSLWQP